LAITDPEAAARVAGAAATLREQLGGGFSQNERERFERGLTPARERLCAARFDAMRGEGRLLPLEQVTVEAQRLVLTAVAG
jgi:hypothetical protein